MLRAHKLSASASFLLFSFRAIAVYCGICGAYDYLLDYLSVGRDEFCQNTHAHYRKSFKRHCNDEQQFIFCFVWNACVDQGEFYYYRNAIHLANIHCCGVNDSCIFLSQCWIIDVLFSAILPTRATQNLLRWWKINFAVLEFLMEKRRFNGRKKGVPTS